MELTFLLRNLKYRSLEDPFPEKVKPLEKTFAAAAAAAITINWHGQGNPRKRK